MLFLCRFLRKELSSSQLDLISSRSEVKVLLEELATYKTGKDSTEQFPDLLLSSLDKLYEDKQQQLWLITSIHNSIEKHKKSLSNSSITESPSLVGGSSLVVGDSSPEVGDSFARGECDSCEEDSLQISERNISNNSIVLNLNIRSNDSKAQNVENKKHPSLTLELQKAYDFNPTSWSKRSLTTPSSMFSPKLQSWTPTTPTPGSALRPSLSLHNLASKTFTEVLVPSIKAPGTHQITPPNSASPNSPRIVGLSPNLNERKLNKPQTNKVDPNTIISPSPKLRIISTSFSSQIQPKSKKMCVKKNFRHPQPPPLNSPSQNSLNFRSYTSLSSLSEISENKIFVERKIKKEISV